jgi:diguanylate cyclase (GGDEF)-like protein
MTFDLRTIYAMTAIACIVLGLFQGFAYFTGRFERWLAFWSASNILVGVGSLCIAFRGLVPDFVATEVGNGVTIVGCLLLPVSLRLFSGRRVDATVLLAAIIVINVPLLLMSEPEQWSQRITFSSIIFAMIDLSVARESFRLWRDEGLTSALLAASLFGMTALMYLSRALLAHNGQLGDAGLFQPGNGIHAMIGLSALLFVTLRSMLVMLMGMERANLRLQDAAYRDPLTGVLNRSGLARWFSGLTAMPIAVLVVDVDRFKEFNDSCGHAIGDNVLRAFAQAAGSVVGPHGLIARHGGDEFVVVLKGRSLEQAVLVAENLRIAFSLRTAGLDVSLPVRPTLSIGAAAHAGGTVDLPSLLHQADQALYRRKRDGRDGVDVYSPELAA